jgi:diaminopimelate epimerase
MIPFSKYQGTGNDFIIIDNRTNVITLTNKQVNFLCDRRFGIGADGLMLLQNTDAKNTEGKTFDFEMVYYNADGKPSTMCGNGGRCLVQFAKDNGIVKENYLFVAVDGAHEANFSDNGWVNLKMQNVDGIKSNGSHYILNTGSPHLVNIETDIMKVNVFEKGKQIRYSKEFEAEGINVNFVETLDEDKIYVRTYERGVEDETLSCGTGVTAAALVCAHNDRGFNVIEVKTLGGNLRVEYDKIDEDSFENIWLCGPATFVFKGEISLNH